MYVLSKAVLVMTHTKKTTVVTFKIRKLKPDSTNTLSFERGTRRIYAYGPVRLSVMSLAMSELILAPAISMF